MRRPLIALAEMLAAARAGSDKIDGTLLDQISSEVEALEVQQQAAKFYSSKQIGYKIGATSMVAQKIIGCDGPFFGPLFESDIFENGAQIQNNDKIIGLECEFAFHFAKDCQLTRETADRTQLLEAVESCHPAIEIIGRRTTGRGLPGYFGAIADFGANVGFVPGPAIENWQAIDLGNVAVTGIIDGHQTNSGSGSEVLGNPINALLWLVERLVAEGKGIKAGEWVTTGTCLGVIEPAVGKEIRGDFGELGSVSVKLV